ncbi:hypothetical protein [Gimesia sp.]|uniref:hypothetical protein n=1 Tax=Gimesia sp. TaxID=2024833 RepID=UPI003A940A34
MKSLFRMNRFFIAFLCFCSLLAVQAIELQAGTIPEEIQKQIPAVLDYLNQRQLKNVGVLKFRVKKPGEKVSSAVGPLNSLLADRLEVALILGNPFDADQQINIIKDASSQVADIENANHLNATGRAVLFGPEFKLAWGDKTVKADAFLTGVVQIHEDRKRATIGILCFDKKGGDLEKACPLIEADLDPTTLGELGESFVLRGAFDGGAPQLTFKQSQERKKNDALTQTVRVKTGQNEFPLMDDSAPINLEILYDGRPVDIEFRNGQAFVMEPREGQEVQMILKYSDLAKRRVGAVLKVNGENTLYRQTQRDIDCSKWILSPEHRKTIVKGYQLKNNQAQQFKVLSQSESQKRAMDYGRQVGQIQLTVFPELTGPKPTPSLPEAAEEDLLAMLRGTQPAKQPLNLSALKQQLRTAGSKQLETRGLIVEGDTQKNKVTTVKFTPDPTPAMTVTIHYYTP